MARRQHVTLLVVVAVLTFLGATYLWSGRSTDGYSLEFSPSNGSGSKADLGAITDNILKGGSIAPKLGNETAKYVSTSATLSCRIVSSLRLSLMPLEIWRLTRAFQGRTRAGVLETLPHDDGSIPRRTD